MLYTPPSQFQFEYDDTTVGSANFATIATGIAATASGSTNTKGSWAEIVSATDRDWYGFWLMFSAAVGQSGLNASQLCDIGIGAGGSEAVVLPNFVMGGQPVISSGVSYVPNNPVYVPLFIPKGTRVAVRTQAAVASRVARCHLWAESGASLPKTIFSGCDTYGASTAASTGVALSSNASANTFGSWTNVGSITSRDYKAILMSHQGFASASVSARNYVLEGGYNSTAMMRLLAAASNAETWMAFLNSQLVVQNIPTGTQLQARIACATASNTDTPSVAFHCFY